MKYLLSVCLSIIMLIEPTAHAGGRMKEVCRPLLDKSGNPILDKKSGTPAQKCKMIKVRKKLEGTPVPVKR